MLTFTFNNLMSRSHSELDLTHMNLCGNMWILLEQSKPGYVMI